MKKNFIITVNTDRYPVHNIKESPRKKIRQDKIDKTGLKSIPGKCSKMLNLEITIFFEGL